MSDTPRPVLYLDVDGMLLRHPDEKRFVNQQEFEAYWRENKGGGPANGVREFLEWATTHCECRWLTAWACSGDMDAKHYERLAALLRVPKDLLHRVNANPLPWNGDKTQGINFGEGREWFWLDDETIGREIIPLRERGCADRLIKTDSSRDPDALLKSWAFIRERLNCPSEPRSAAPTHCDDCDRPDLCDVIKPKTAPCGQNRGFVPGDLPPLDYKPAPSSQRSAPPTRVWEGLPQMNPDPIIAEVEADPRAFEWTTLALVAEIRRLRARPQEGAADSARDAERWRKLVGMSRLRIVGSAGTPPYHMGVELWHDHPTASLPESLVEFTAFVDAARGADATATPPHSTANGGGGSN